MLEAIVQPWNFAILVALMLLLGQRGVIPVSEFARKLLFLLFQMAVLGWVLGTWKGIIFYLLYIGLIGWGIRRLGPSRPRSGWWCAAIVAVIVAVLLLAKYYLPHSVRGALALKQVWATISLSFLTFRLIHVAMDVHAGLIPCPNWLTFLNYAFFVPVSVAGPIQNYGEFDSQFSNGQVLFEEEFVFAIRRLVFGIAKKVLIAAPLSPYVLGNMEPAGSHPFLLLMAACLLYSVYIYVDFSGYTDIAIGCAALAGVKLPENFNRPYLATNLQDFWSRWHMTLTAWLRTYLFYPLNKMLVYRFPGQAKKVDPMIAVIITFALAGMWHGDGWNFLVFGLMHGVGIAAFLLFRGKSRATPSPLGVFLSRAGTLIYVSLAWIPFVYPLEEIPWLIHSALH